MEHTTLAIVAGVLGGLLTTLLLLPLVDRLSRENNLLQRDLSERERKYYPRLGGVSLALGLLVGASAGAVVLSPTPGAQSLFLLLSCVLAAGILGITEDLYGMGWKTKLLLPVLCSAPLIVSRIGHTTLDLPLLGPRDLGLFYLLVLIPLGVTGGINAIGMIGKTGNIEAVMGLILLAGMTTAGLLAGAWVPAVLFATGMGAMIGFVLYNLKKKVFLGYSGTFLVGATIVSGSIGGDMEKIGVAMLALYFLNLVIHLCYVARHGKRGKPYLLPRDDGRLYTDEANTLIALIARATRPTRKQLIAMLAVLQAIVCAAVIILMV